MGCLNNRWIIGIEGLENRWISGMGCLNNRLISGIEGLTNA